MAENERNAGFLAGIGQPVPVEGAFATDGEVMTIGLDNLQEVVEIVSTDVSVDEDLAVPVHEARGWRLTVPPARQLNPAVGKSGRFHAGGPCASRKQGYDI